MEATKYYGLQHMVRIGCGDCKGCSDCCRDMGNSVVLTPYDVHTMSIGLGMSVDDLFAHWLQLGMTDGLLQPSMAMDGPGEACHGLDAEGRCSIHKFRPSICRLFPLGRQYTDAGISYFVLEGACPATPKSKVKIEKWVERPEFKEHETFLIQWHSFKKECLKKLEACGEDYAKQLHVFVLQLFFRKPYTQGKFYEEFLQRLSLAKEVLAEES